MPKLLTVTTDVGTFSRETARPYTHVVVISQRRAEVLEARRREDLASTRREVDAYRRGVDTQGNSLQQRWFDQGKVAEWIADLDARVARLEAQGPITTDEPLTWGTSNWASRRDLADEYAAALTEFRHVRVYEVATGRCVRETNHAVETPEAIQGQWARHLAARRHRRGRR